MVTRLGMRLRRITVALLALSASFAACGDSNLERVVDGGICGSLTDCGGDIVGTWTVSDWCLADTNAYFNSVLNPKCDGSIKGTNSQVSGTYTYRKDGTADVDLGYGINFDAVFSATCVGTINDGRCATFAKEIATPSTQVACNRQGDTCACLVSTTEPLFKHSVDYQIHGKSLQQDGVESPYCVQGNTLRILRTQGKLTGMLVLERAKANRKDAGP